MTDQSIVESTTDENALAEQQAAGAIDQPELSVEELATQAEDDFASGYKKVSGEEDEEQAPAAKVADDEASQVSDPVEETKLDADDDKTEQDASVESPDQSTDQAAAASQNTEDASTGQEAKLKKQIRSLEAKYGGLMTKMDQIIQSQSSDGTDTDGPSPEELKAALKDSGKMSDLVERYQDFAPIQDELQHIHQKIGEGAMSEAQVDEIVNQRMTARQLEEAHPAWEETMGTEAFRDHCLEGGPSLEEFGAISQLERDAKDIADPALKQQAFEEVNRQLDNLSDDHPVWWKAKGSDVFSSKAQDTIRLFDGFESHNAAQTTATEDAATRREATKQRLKNAIRPKTTAGQVSTGKSDDDAFASGFKKGSS